MTSSMSHKQSFIDLNAPGTWKKQTNKKRQHPISVADWQKCLNSQQFPFSYNYFHGGKLKEISCHHKQDTFSMLMMPYSSWLNIYCSMITLSTPDRRHPNSLQSIPFFSMGNQMYFGYPTHPYNIPTSHPRTYATQNSTYRHCCP